MIRIGITGGIGSGKSVVTTLLQISGIPIYITDLESKKLLESSSIIRKKLTDLLGTSIYTSTGLNRKRMASLIFNDSKLLKRVNGIIHPEVAYDFNTWLGFQQTTYAALESAILFESGFNHMVDISLLVYTPEDLRIERTIKRDKVTRAEVMRRIQNQQSDEEKKELVDYVIYNDEKSALIPQVEDFLVYLNTLYIRDEIK